MARRFALAFAFSAAALFGAAFQSAALAPGDKAPSLHVEKWFDGGAKAPAPASYRTPPYDVVMLFDPAEPGAYAFLSLLDAVRDANPERVREIKAVAKGEVKSLGEFLSRNPALSFPVGVDSEDGATFKLYCDTDSILPLAFVFKADGSLAWAGHPTGIESVVKRLDDGSFSVSTQRKITALRTELQTALRSGLGAVILKNADRILSIDPGDMIAIQAKLFVYEGQGALTEAREFLEKTLKLRPDDFEIRLVYLGLLARSGELEAFKGESLKSFDAVKGSLSRLGRLAAFLLETSPFGALPVAATLDAAKRNLEAIPADAAPSKRAVAYEILARASYESCRVDEAVTNQTKAVELRKGGPYEKAALQLLDFYKGVKRSSQNSQ